MLQLKQYQQRVLNELADYLRSVVKLDNAKLAFYGMTDRTYKPIPGLEGLPYVCLRLPTGGGKTLVAAYGVGVAAREYLRREFPVVLWLVPSNAIREQTLKALRDRRHPYRQVLDADFGGRVTVMDIREALFVSRATLEGGVCLVVSTLAALRREDTEGLKVYEPNGALMDHFSALPAGAEEWLERADGLPIYSLANLLRLHRPLVIVDEAHNARTPLSFETLARFRPACILEFTATPAADSNVLATASAAQLHAEAMIKLPIKLQAYPDWKQALQEAIRQRDQLEQLARAEQAASGEYVRPIILLQAQPHHQAHETLTVEVLQEALQTDFHVPKSQIAVATGEQRGIEGVDLFDPACELRFILTVQALAEGWDCSFAYILCSVAQITTARAVEQILGRVLRLPHARRKGHLELNQAYAYVTSKDFDRTAHSLTDALVENGFERYEARTAVETPPLFELPLFRRVEPSPAEQGVPFQVPRLVLQVEGQLELFEESFLPIQWALAQCDPALSEAEYSGKPPEGQAIEIYLDDQEHLRERFIGALHAQLSLLDRTAGWTANELTLWLDRNIPHPDVPQSQSSFFLRRLIDHLVQQRGIPLERLVHDRFRLREAAQARIAQHRQAAKTAGFQRALAPEMRSLLEVSPDYAFRFAPDRYPANWYYEGAYDFQKHYYRAVGELKSEGEEFQCARFIDSLPQVKHWVRNLDRRGFWFQTSTDRFYPDFVAELADGRCVIVEYKAGYIYDAPDAVEKRLVGEVWQLLSDGQGIFIMPTRGDFESIRRAIA